MQPLPFGENGVSKRKEKPTAGAQTQCGASGDRLFFLKRGEGLAPKRGGQNRRAGIKTFGHKTEAKTLEYLCIQFDEIAALYRRMVL